jgi:6-phosphogluconolactonase/glucosamine-6-phosphate isomerase/deaminase
MLEVAAAQVICSLDTSHLSIGLADERYGPLGHQNENYTQLVSAGFPLPITRVLTGASIEETAAVFALSLKQILQSADFSLGVFGIGADGHTAGIKPHSPSVTSTKAAVAYTWDDYERITVTPLIVRRLNEAVIYAAGSEKADTLRSLLHEDLPLADQPAQVLKSVKASTLYTDNML